MTSKLPTAYNSMLTTSDQQTTTPTISGDCQAINRADQIESNRDSPTSGEPFDRVWFGSFRFYLSLSGSSNDPIYWNGPGCRGGRSLRTLVLGLPWRRSRELPLACIRVEAAH